MEHIEADIYMTAVGRLPNTAKLGLEEAGVEVDSRGFISVDQDLCSTSAAWCSAAGTLALQPAAWSGCTFHKPQCLKCLTCTHKRTISDVTAQ